jgi:hypothetical protein
MRFLNMVRALLARKSDPLVMVLTTTGTRQVRLSQLVALRR